MFCEQCGIQIPEASKFCNVCGAAVVPLSPSASSVPSTVQASTAQAVQMAPAPAEAPSPTETSVAVEAPSAPIVSTTPTSEPKTHIGALIIGAFLLVAIILGGIALFTSQRNTQTSSNSPLRSIVSVPITRTFEVSLSQGAFLVAPHRYSYFRFTVPQHSTNAHIDGRFDASGGSGNDIEVVVLNAEEFVDWTNNQETKAYYVSGRLTSDTLDVKLPPTTDAPVTYYLVFNNVFSVFSKKTITSDIKLHYDRTL